jgi:hypothetical protein
MIQSEYVENYKDVIILKQPFYVFSLDGVEYACDNLFNAERIIQRQRMIDDIFDRLCHAEKKEDIDRLTKRLEIEKNYFRDVVTKHVAKVHH